MTLAKIKEYFKDHNLCLQTDRATPNSVCFTITRGSYRDANQLKYSDVYWFPPKETDEHVKELRLRAFMNRMIDTFEELERGKNKMKNIAFDISRDGPVGKLVIKDNVYDVCVKEVNSDRTPYNEKTFLNVEVTTPTISPSERMMRIGNYLVENTTKNMRVFYNPTNKDSINEGKVQIKDVIFNPPATIVFWSDGSKTVVKAENEVYDPEKGLAMAIAKRAMGNQGNYFETFKKYTEKYDREISEHLGNIVDEIAKEEAFVDGVLAYMQEHITEPKKPYRIWYEDEEGDIMILYHTRTYIRKGNAINAAKKIFADGHTKWIVSQGNPVITGEWAKKFGSDK